MSPNWCTNTLAVHGDKAEVDKFMEDVKYTDLILSFEAHLPTPDQSKFEDMDYNEQKDNPDYWYNWNIKNWGTKWDAGSTAFIGGYQRNTDGTSTAFYIFDTAWAPPEAWLVHVAPLYPTLSFKLEYREEGMGFSGILGLHRGNVVENQTWEGTIGMDIDQYDEMYGEDVGLTS